MRGKMILDFYQWCEEKKFDLPQLSENQTRSGIRPQYPDGYVRSQYPDGYFAPTSATAFLDLKNAKSISTVADKGGSPL
jgi:hypothetical protein